MAKKKKQKGISEILSHLWESFLFRIYIIVVVAIAFVAVMITVIIQYQNQKSLEYERTKVNTYTLNQLYEKTQKPGLSDFVITSRWDNKDWLYPEPYRSPRKKWSQDEVTRYWIPLGDGPGEIDIKGLRADNMIRLKNLLDEVP